MAAKRIMRAAPHVGAAFSSLLSCWIGAAYAQSPPASVPPQPRVEEGPESSDGPAGQDEEIEFFGPDGKPLPPEVQAQLREQLKRLPPGQLSDEGEIVVRSKTSAKSIAFDAVVERAFTPIEINAYGASTVEDLIAALGPQIASQRSQSDAPPLLLLNGRRIANPLDIASIPTEAIEKLEVFPEDVAAHYGLPSDRKVLNIITLDEYTGLTASGTGSFTTDGGGASAAGDVDLFRIHGDTRLGFGGGYFNSADLTEEQRGIVQPVGSEASAPFRTLLPQIERYSVNGNIARPLGKDTSAALTGRFRSERSNDLIGVSGSSILENARDVKEWEIGANLAGEFGDVRLLVNLLYNGQHQFSGISITNEGVGLDFAESGSSEFLADLTASGIIAPLPAGALRGSITLVGGSKALNTRSAQENLEAGGRRIRDTTGVAANFFIPIFSPASPLGRLSISSGFAFTDLSDVDDVRRLNARVDWSPSRAVRLAFAFTSEQQPPTLDQLGQPVFRTPNVRTLDFVAGETRDLAFVTGGNPDLLNQKSRNLQAQFGLKPFRRLNLSLDATFSSIRTDDLIAPFPLLTTSTTNAFPERFARDASGQLTEIDVRPINFVRGARDQIFWGINFSRPLGPLPDDGQEVGKAVSSLEEARAANPDDLVFTVSRNSSLARQAENLSSRVFANVYHTWFARDEVILAPGAPPLDLRRGDAVDALGGRRQHRIEFVAGAYKSGVGGRIDLRWDSSTALTGSAVTGGESIRFNSLATLNVNIFANLQEVFDKENKYLPLKNSRLTLELINAFNQRPIVQTAQGTTPIRFQGANLDPAGRMISLAFRKSF